MTCYATSDHDDGVISQNAYIAEFETEAEARDYLLRGFDREDWDIEKAEFVAGTFGDCWKKLPDPLRDRPWLIEPFTSDQVHVLAPGQHPGGQSWWIEPIECVAVVLVPPQEATA